MQSNLDTDDNFQMSSFEFGYLPHNFYSTAKLA